eukprot:COSAG06_NODE_16472_length_999_cov_1.143333_3_plen_61_part_00
MLGSFACGTAVPMLEAAAAARDAAASAVASMVARGAALLTRRQGGQRPAHTACILPRGIG